MKSYEVVVVGGGPSGLAAAREAAREGAKTLILEMRASIGPHASFPAVLPQAPRRVRNRVPCNRVIFHSKRASVEVKSAPFVIVDSAELIRHMAVEAVDAGADIWISSPVQPLHEQHDRISKLVVRGPNWKEEIRAEIIVDASGSGDWSSALGGTQSHEYLVSNEYLIAGRARGGLDVYFSSYRTPGGFAWLAPTPSSLISAGVRGHRFSPDVALEEFCGQTFRQEPAVPLAAARRVHPRVEGAPELVCGNLVRVGSAAGWFAPLSLGSTRYSVLSGEVAGKLAAESVSCRDLEPLAAYPSICEDEIGVELRKHNEFYQAFIGASDLARERFLRTIEGSSLARALADVITNRAPVRALRKLLSSQAISLLKS
jgi:digeranylgeranylglycerophospholipid reductase